MSNNANAMRGQRPETVVVQFLADMLSANEAREVWATKADVLARRMPLFFYAVRQACNRMTQRELGERLEVDHTYISKVENGVIQPGQDQMDRLIELLAEYGFTYSGDKSLHQASAVVDSIGG